jgi:ubiquinone/menaquinone biosynthesis C-methylase UbiE
MRISIAIIFFLAFGICKSQDPWKNIYSQHAWAERDTWQKPDELLKLLNLRKGSSVADVGCHEGYMTFKLADRVGQAGAVYAVDLDEGKLEKLRSRADDQNLKQIHTVQGTQTNPRLPENILDGVLILDTYHEMDAHEEVLQHIKASLKDGGRLVICEPIADERKGMSRDQQERKHELALEFALEDLKKAGFKILFQENNYIDRTKQKGDRMWVVVAGK